MCDCYYQRCEVCKKGSIPVHIADFCMPRENVKIYCQRHIPKRDVVMHKLIEAPGWKMGVRYLKNPPFKHGYTAVVPNVTQEHTARVITKFRKAYWITEWTGKEHNSEIGAVKKTIERQRPFSPAQQVWRRYLLALEGKDALRKLNIPFSVRGEINIASRNLKRRYKDLLGIILIGSFAEGGYQKHSDIDIVFVTKGRVKHGDLSRLTGNIKRDVQLIPFKRKTLNEHFKNSTTMAYAIQRGKIIYQKKNFLDKYFRWPLEWPSGEWMKRWFKHWQEWYTFGVKGFLRNKKRKFDYVTDFLPRSVVNFSILFLETRGIIPTTKKNLEKCFSKEIQDRKVKRGLRVAIKSYREEGDISINDAEEVYLTGEFLKNQMQRYFQAQEEREKRWKTIKKFIKRKKDNKI